MLTFIHLVPQVRRALGSEFERREKRWHEPPVFVHCGEEELASGRQQALQGLQRTSWFGEVGENIEHRDAMEAPGLERRIFGSPCMYRAINAIACFLGGSLRHFDPRDVPSSMLHFFEQMPSRASDFQEASIAPRSRELLHPVRLVPSDGTQRTLSICERGPQFAVMGLDLGVVRGDGVSICVCVCDSDTARVTGQ